MSDKLIPAFPQPAEIMGRGMTLRDYFAAKAIPECIQVAADQTTGTGDATYLSELFTKASGYAYFMADAMLKAREV